MKPRSIVLITFALFMFLKQIFFNFSSNMAQGSFFNEENMLMTAACLASSLILTALLSLLNGKVFRIVFFGTLVFMSALLFSDILYYKYYYNVLTIPLIYQLGIVDKVSDSIYSLVNPLDFLLFIDIIVVTIIFKILGKKGFSTDKESSEIRTPFIMAGAGLLVLLMVFVNTPFKTAALDNTYIIRRMGVINFRVVNTTGFIYDSIFRSRNFKDDEIVMIEEVLDDRVQDERKFFANARGKNLIILQLEAIQQFVMGLEINGQEVTPNLNRFKEKSISFNNMFYQTAGGNSSDAEFLVNTSLYPADEGAVFFMYDKNKYHSIAKILKEEGYLSYSFHANDPTFWNREVMHDTLGFHEFYGEASFDIEQIMGWGLTDELFYEQAFELFDSDKPFYAFLISLTSHYPFNFFGDYDFDTSGIENQLLSDYLKAANYADLAFGVFLDKLEEKGLLEDSIVVVYGDHQAIPKQKIDSFEELFGRELDLVDWIKLQRIPAMIYYKGFEPMSVNMISGQIDIMPTLLNLLGLDSSMCLGRDILNSNESYAVLRNGTVITDEFIYVSQENSVYDSLGNGLELERYLDKIENFQRALKASDLIIYKDYFSIE